MPVCRHSPPRADARPVVALRRRQVDDRAQPARKRPRASSCPSASRRGRAAAARSTACTIISSRSASSSGCAIPTRCSNGPKFTAISTPRRASRSRAAMAEGRDMLFDIDWQGAQQLKEKMRGRHRLDLHPAAVDGGTEERACKRRAEDHGRGHRDAAEERPRRDRALARVRLSSSSTTISTAPSREVRAIVTAERLRRDRRPGLFDFVSGLLDEKVAESGSSSQESVRVRPFKPRWPAPRIPRRRASRPAACRRCRPLRAALRRRGSSGSAAASCGAGRRRLP